MDGSAGPQVNVYFGTADGKRHVRTVPTSSCILIEESEIPMEARADEACQVSPIGYAQMPNSHEARHALAIHGERDNFRTITITFADEQQAREFDTMVINDGVRHAITQSTGHFRVERRP